MEADALMRCLASGDVDAMRLLLLSDRQEADEVQAELPVPVAVAQVDDGQQCSLFRLPEDATVYVLSGVAAIDVLAVRSTCSYLRRITDSESLWEALCWRHYKKVRSSVVAGSWREVYKEHCLLHAGERERVRKQKEAARREGHPHVSRGGMSASVAELFYPLMR